MGFVACKKDYLSGGTILNPNVNLTTYDYLKTNPIFDTLVLLIDKAGLKDEINGDITFFAPTDYAIQSLINIRTLEIQIKYNDENITYTIDSFPVNELRDSLRSYLFDNKITRNDVYLNADKLYKNNINDQFSVLLREGEPIPPTTTKPQYMHIVKVIKGLDEKDADGYPVDGIPDEKKDRDELIQTSGIITTTGVLHVINNYHIFYWR